MKHIKILIFILFFLLLAHSCEEKNTIHDKLEIYNYSSYSSKNLDSVLNLEPKKIKYDSLIQTVLEDIGLPSTDIEIRTSRQFGAFAVITKNCRRRIFAYNEAFFDSLIKATNSVNPIKSICFHEISHHFYRHPLKSKWESHVHELQADRYSGFQMRKLGATEDEAIAAILLFGDDTSTPTHPNKHTRMKEIKAGYYDAGKRLFNDKMTISNDSIYVYKKIFSRGLNEIVKSNNQKFAKFKFFEKSITIPNMTKKSFSDIKFGNDLKVYGFLNKIIRINDKNEVVDIQSKEVVGTYEEPFPNSNHALLKFETSTYIIENDTIYSNTPDGIKLSLGSKIN